MLVHVLQNPRYSVDIDFYQLCDPLASFRQSMVVALDVEPPRVQTRAYRTVPFFDLHEPQIVNILIDLKICGDSYRNERRVVLDPLGVPRNAHRLLFASYL